MFKHFKILLLFTVIFYSLSAYASPQLANYLGTGNNPRLHLELSAKNGPGWKSFTIDYQQIGNIPSSTNPKNDWSPWNVKDEKGNFYGTITLHSDGKTAWWSGDYTQGQQGYSLESISFSFKAPNYQLTVKKINHPVDGGPFPNAPLAQPAVYPGTNTKITLSVNGANMVTDKGTKIILKGLVRPSLEWNAQGEKLSVQDIKAMKQWGANVIRIDLNQNYWFESAPVTTMGSYKQIINAIVYYAIENDMAVILDLHWTENGHQNSMANKNSLQFWQEVATEYKNFGTVIFELFNEPVGIDKTVWLNGDNNYAGYQQLYDAVRSVGAENICIVNGLSWGYDLSFVNDNFKVNGTNIVYGSHPYNRTSIDDNFRGLLNKFPIIFTEFGVNDNNLFPNGYKNIYKAIIDFAHANNVSYTGFAWWVDSDSAKRNAFPDLIKDWDGTPLNGGVYVHDDMQAYPATNLGS